jgi:hypothetical protein
MARKAFATSFEKAAAENSAGPGGLIFEGQSSQPERKAGVYVFYRASKEALKRDPSLRIFARDEFVDRRKLDIVHAAKLILLVDVRGEEVTFVRKSSRMLVLPHE